MSSVVDEAVAMARGIRSPRARTGALTSVVSLLSPPESVAVSEEAFAAATACAGEREIGAALLRVLWSQSTAEHRPQLVRRATEVVRTFEDPVPMAKLMRDVVFLGRGEQTRAQRLAAALRAARAIADPAERAATLDDLPIRSEDVRLAEEVYGDALDALDAIDHPDARVAALLELAYHLPTSLRERAIAMARAARDPVLSINALEGAAANGPQRLDDEAWTQALACAREVGDPAARVAALIALASWRSDMRDAFGAEALACARQVADPSARVATLVALGSWRSDMCDAFWAEALEAIASMPDPRSRTEELAACVVNAPDSAFPTVLDLLDGLHSDRARARVLSSMVPLPPPAIRWRVITAARTLADPWARATALYSLFLDRRPWDGSPDARAVRRAFEDTLAAARAIDDPRPRARLLTSLVEHAPGEEAGDLLQEAYETASDVADPLQRAQALAGVAVLAAEDRPNGRPRVLAEAVTAARAIEPPAARARALTRLAGLYPWRERQPFYGEALAAIAAIGDEEARVKELSRLIDDDQFRVAVLSDT